VTLKVAGCSGQVAAWVPNRGAACRRHLDEDHRRNGRAALRIEAGRMVAPKSSGEHRLAHPGIRMDEHVGHAGALR
jgi:hypothetical protein